MEKLDTIIASSSIPFDLFYKDSEVKKSFMPNLMRSEPRIIDSTAMMGYKTCPRYYFFRFVLGRTPRKPNIYLLWGSIYHKFREVLSRNHILNAIDVNGAFKQALTVALDKWDKGVKELPIGTEYDFMTRERLIAMCVYAFEYYKSEIKKGSVKTISVEQPFIVQLPDGKWTAGRADRLDRIGGRLWGRDYKTTKKLGDYYTRTLEPNDQFTRYTYAESKLHGEQVQGQIIEVMFNSKTKGPEIFEFTTTRSNYQIELWLKDHAYWSARIDESREIDHYPANEKSCAFCIFHQVCKMPSESGMISTLNSQYATEPWNCTETRNDD